MKNDYLKEQYLLQTEQPSDFGKNALAALYFQNSQTLFSHYCPEDFLSTLQLYISGNLEILKLYVASHLSACTAAGHKAGLPIQICENLKKEAFTKIAKAKNEDELSKITQFVFSSMKEAGKKYSFRNCSHTIQRAIDYIHIRKFQPLSASDVAEYLNVERTHLSKQFHKETGITLTDYIHTVKTETAAALITSHEYTLIEISDLLGYSSYRYFAQVYKKYQHCLPAQTAAMACSAASSSREAEK